MALQPRQKIATLVLSASALVGLVMQEGWSPIATIPTKNDRATVGFGSTFKEDGSAVKLGETITPQKALARTLNHVGKDELKIKQCVTAPLNQTEYDILTDFAYQYGTSALCRSSIVRHANAGNYAASCEAYKQFRFAANYDCSTLINGQPNKRCWGVWTRSKERRDKCVGAQQ
jgi:GH24 family phage-related lysozyme (muramidase)